MDIIVSNDCIDYNFSQDFLIRNCSLKKEFIWILQHNDVFTFGKSFNSKIPNFIHDIPCQKSNRGGDITLHNKGQIVVYFCLDIKQFLKRNNLTFDLNYIICIFEEIIIKILTQYHINAFTNKINRGVFIKDNNDNLIKIAFIGINFKQNFLLNGFSINFNNDLKPFTFINPCNLDCKITSIQHFYTKNDIQKKLSINEFIQDLKCILDDYFSKH